MSIILPGSEDTNKYGGQIINPDAPRNDLFSVAGEDVQDPWQEQHDVKTTHETIQQMLAGGTPNWVKWPKEYKAMAKEDFASHRENSEKLAAGYKWADQEMLTDKKARCINGITTRDFIEKLRANGISCAVFDNGFLGPGGRPTVGLWCVPPNRTDRLRPICYLDVPMMWEWSILKLNEYGMPSGEESRGWRTVAVQLVEKEIITEAQCHRIFGVPAANRISDRYYRSLWEKRHGRRYQDEDERGLTE